MAGEKGSEATFKTEGRQTLEFDLLDDRSIQEVIKCIQAKGKIKVILRDIGDIGNQGGFRQLID